MMNATERGPEDQSIKERFPGFSVVWHRADNRKGIVQGWLEYCDGAEAINVCWGSESSNEMPDMLVTSDPEKEFAPKQ